LAEGSWQLAKCSLQKAIGQLAKCSLQKAKSSWQKNLLDNKK
jgi:hypothetical protein